MIAELHRLCDAIPHADLTIQWDFCLEMILIDGQLSHRFAMLDISIDTIMERMRRISSAIPNDVDLGIHLCYGDLDGKHTINPQSAEKMVDAANALTSAVERPLSYIHFPVPLERADEEFFAPLSKLDLSRDTAIYLGVVHAADGAEGTRRRIASAQRFLPIFGIASECGIARRTPETFLKFLDVYDLTSRPERPR
jgi:methionine synthase II (cobalamin-independent)